MEEVPTLADLIKLMKNQGNQLAAITTKISTIQHIESKVSNIKTLVVPLKEENKELHIALQEKDKQLVEM